MDLSALSDLAQILGGIAVVIGIAFGIAQIRQFQQQRLDVAALELMRSIQDREFTHAFRLVYPLESSVRTTDLAALGIEFEEAAIALGTRFEAMGLLVFRGSLPIHLVEEIVGGTVVLLWRKLQPWVGEVRIRQGHPLLFEWFQWLADRLVDRGRPGQAPAYDRHRDWKPKQ